MNKPERLPHPDFTQWLPASLRGLADDQKAIPRIAKDTALMREIEAVLPTIPTTHDLWRGDARALDFIPDNSVHLVLTSPPYWTLKRYNPSDAQMGDIEDYEAFLTELGRVWQHCYRTLVPGGRLVCVVGDVCLSRRKNAGEHTVVPLHSAIQEHCRGLGFSNLSPIIWNKIANAVYEADGNGGGFLGKPYEPNGVINTPRGQVFHCHILHAILLQMARPLRLEFAGGLYHVTARGDGREDIYLSEADREMWLEVFGQVCKRFNWICHAWCQMDNHYHLLIETPEANLSKGMRQLNGVYTQRYNRTHDRVGHVFQGRYKAILVERDSYLLELARYIVLNPLRAKMVKRLEVWPWSSYLATCGQASATEYLQTDWILAQFGRQRASAIRKYVEFVHEGARLPSVWTQLQGQIYLGSDAFVKKMQAQIEKKPTLDEIPRAQRRALTQALPDFERRYERNEAIARAYLSGQHTMAAIAQHFGVHYTTVSRLVSAYEDAVKG